MSRRGLVFLLLALLVLSSQAAPTPEDLSTTGVPEEVSSTTEPPPPPQSPTPPSISREASKISNDLIRLYTAVSSFISTLFGDTKSDVTPSDDVTTPASNTTEFADFEDPDEEKEREEAQQRADEDFLRYVRDVSTPNTLLGYVLEEISGDAGVELRRHARDLQQGNGSISTFSREVMRRARRVAERYYHQPTHRSARQARQNLFQGYYDFIINEYSYKFWAVYMLAACALLGYSAVAAIYFSKFNTSAIDYETYDDFARSNTDGSSGSSSNPLGLVGSLVSVQTFQRIMDALASRKYS